MKENAYNRPSKDVISELLDMLTISTDFFRTLSAHSFAAIVADVSELIVRVEDATNKNYFARAHYSNLPKDHLTTTDYLAGLIALVVYLNGIRQPGPKSTIVDELFSNLAVKTQKVQACCLALRTSIEGMAAVAYQGGGGDEPVDPTLSKAVCRLVHCQLLVQNELSAKK
ncbi:hypothetical protein LCGC14_1751920 [marine sediment metagenome]|uniref:Uncharacterized protein n=1 Tax=marine sediment metagenome TaxID=412755 RepID=A0A0F9JIQ4_9ZZZZ